MSLFLDSADLEHAQRAGSLGFVVGATTNPALLAKAGHDDPVVALKTLCTFFPGPVFHQLTARSVEEMRVEAGPFLNLAENMGFKIMCTLPGLQFAADFAGKMKIAVTGIFSPAQAYLAAEAKADFIIPYVNRLTRYAGAGQSVVRDMAEILLPTETELLAAGIKSGEEAIETLLSGADHVSLPLNVIEAMAESELTLQAYANFDSYTSRK